MSNRVVYGNSWSSNGWPMVDEGSCTWVDIPGTNPTVRIQIQNGQPLAILRAFVADINAYVEHVTDSDTGCWTAGNSVSTSNHLSGTAVDISWSRHPFRIANAGWSQDQINTIRQILDFFEGTVFWGNDWSDPKDSMHFQLASLANGGNIDTYGNPHTGDFIARKIRADGFSTFRRDNQPVPVTPPLSRADGYAAAIIGEGQRRGVTPRGQQIALSVALVESGLKNYANSNVPESMNIPHDAVGSDHDSLGLFQQRCPMWGPAEVLMNPALSAGLFYDRLVTLDYNNTSRLPGDYAADVQRPAAQYRGRYQDRMGDAVALYNRLANTTTPGDDMAAVPQNEWNAVRDIVLAQVESWSPFRRPGETTKVPWQRMLQAMDANTHGPRTIILAAHGHPGSIQDLRLVADLDPNRFPDRADDKNLATAILADLATEDGRQKRLDAAVAQLTGGLVTSVQSIPPTVYSAPVGDSNGAKVGQFVDAADNLPPVSQKTIDALHTALEVRPA